MDTQKTNIGNTGQNKLSGSSQLNTPQVGSATQIYPPTTNAPWPLAQLFRGFIAAIIVTIGCVLGTSAAMALMASLASADLLDSETQRLDVQNVGPSQGEMVPEPDSISTRTFITPMEMAEWINDELVEIGSYDPLIVVKDGPSEFFFLARSLEEGQLDELEISFSGCRESYRSSPWEKKIACDQGWLSTIVDDCRALDGFDYRSLEDHFGPLPTGFFVQPFHGAHCVVSIALPMVAEGPLLLIENLDWFFEIIEVSDDGFKSIGHNGASALNGLGFRSVDSWNEKLATFKARADLELTGFPEAADFITTDQPELFASFADQIGYILPEPNWMFEPHIILSDTGLITATLTTECSLQTGLNCDGMEFYRWEYFREGDPSESFLSMPGTHLELPQHNEYGAGGWVTLNVNSPTNGISPALLKSLLKGFDEELRTLQNSRSDEDVSIHASYLSITEEMVADGEYKCSMEQDAQGHPLPEAAFYRDSSGVWQFTSNDCDLYFNEGYSDAQAIDFFADYLNRLDRIFPGEEWRQLDWFVIAHQPDTNVAGQYYPAATDDDGENYAPGIVLNLQSSMLEELFSQQTIVNLLDLYSKQMIDTMVHEYAHHLHYSHTWAKAEQKYSGIHGCIEFATAAHCKDFNTPFGQFLRAFWWDHSEGFSNREDYNGYYRLINSPADFVTYYAAYNAYEDFAESFTAAVLNDYYASHRPDGVGQAKVDFFLADDSPYKAHVEEIRSKLFAEFKISDPASLTTDLHDVGFVRKLMNWFQ